MKIKKDRYRKSRGGSSQVFQLSCSKCGSGLLKYQKDGVGSLIRLYIDRIVEDSFRQIDTNLTCPTCGNLIGIPMVYKAEDRKAYRLVRGSFSKSKLQIDLKRV